MALGIFFVYNKQSKDRRKLHRNTNHVMKGETSTI